MQIHETTLKFAIQDKRNIAFGYQGSKDDSATKRVVQPYVYGRKSNGKAFVFGMQVEGGTSVGVRLYEFDNMVRITMVEGIFDQPEFDVQPDQWLEIFESVS